MRRDRGVPIARDSARRLYPTINKIEAEDLREIVYRDREAIVIVPANVSKVYLLMAKSHVSRKLMVYSLRDAISSA